MASLFVTVLLFGCHYVTIMFDYVVVKWRRTCNREVAGLSSGRSAPRNDPGQVVHTHVPLFTKQYKLVPAQAGS